MPPERERKPDLETNTPPDLVGDDLRRRDQRTTPPDSKPPRGDGGNADHPIHDDDPAEDAGPGDYERGIARVDAGARQ